MRRGSSWAGPRIASSSCCRSDGACSSSSSVGLGWSYMAPLLLLAVAALAGWTSCPRCRTELERRPGSVHCPACGFREYASSVPTASALVVDDEGRVLLARRAGEPEQGKWDLPGGFLDEGEHPRDGLVRELREETGLEIEPREFFGAWIDRYGDDPGAAYTLNLFWRATATAGEPRPADDVDEVRFFARDELPPPSELAFTTIVDVLRAWQEDT